MYKRDNDTQVETEEDLQGVHPDLLVNTRATLISDYISVVSVSSTSTTSRPGNSVIKKMKTTVIADYFKKVRELKEAEKAPEEPSLGDQNDATSLIMET